MRHAVFGITEDVMENPAEHIDLMTKKGHARGKQHGGCRGRHAEVPCVVHNRSC